MSIQRMQSRDFRVNAEKRMEGINQNKFNRWSMAHRTARRPPGYRFQTRNNSATHGFAHNQTQPATAPVARKQVSRCHPSPKPMYRKEISKSKTTKKRKTTRWCRTFTRTINQNPRYFNNVQTMQTCIVSASRSKKKKKKINPAQKNESKETETKS